MRPFKGWTCGLGWLPTLTLALGACQQAETGTGSGRPTAPDSSIDFATDPSILRGKWTGVGVSDSYGEIVFSSDGALFAACTQQGLTVWEVATDAERFRGTCAQPLSMGFSPDASLLVLRDPRTIRVLSGESGVVLASAEAKTLPYRTTNAPVFSPDGSLFITDEAFETDVGEDSRLRFWQLNKEADEKVVLAPGARVGAGEELPTPPLAPTVVTSSLLKMVTSAFGGLGTERSFVGTETMMVPTLSPSAPMTASTSAAKTLSAGFLSPATP